MKVAVVILNWNGEEMLKKFLPTVISSVTTPDCEVIVADNGSTDCSLDTLQKQFPTTRVILLDKNYGFAEGYNRALKEVEAEYFLLLNSDVELKSDPLPPLIELLDKNPEIGAVMPKILSQQNPTMFEYAGAAGGYIDRFCFPFCRGRIISTLEEDKGQYDTAKEVFWASGAALFVRSSLYEKAGGLDADFFAHMEEIDFCWRIKNMGHKVYCEPRSVVYHLGGGALNSESPFKLYLNFRNNLFMMHKNLVHPKGKIFIRMIIDGMLAVVYLLQGKKEYYSSVIKAHNDYRGAKKSLDKKREKICPKEVSCVYDGSIIWSYARGKKLFNKLKI